MLSLTHVLTVVGLSRDQGKKVPDGLKRLLYLLFVAVNRQGNRCL